MFVNMTVNCMTDVGYWIPPAWLLCLESVSHLLVSRPVCPDVEIKSSPKFFKNAPKVATSVFTYKVVYFKIPQKVTKYLDYFWTKNLLQRTLKIAQSGQTGLYAVPLYTILITFSAFGALSQSLGLWTNYSYTCGGNRDPRTIDSKGIHLATI